jgi:hypothetical protein
VLRSAGADRDLDGVSFSEDRQWLELEEEVYIERKEGW